MIPPKPQHGTYPAGLLRIHPDVPAPHGPPIVRVSGDVGEGGDGGARVGDRSAVQEAAQRGAQRRQHLYSQLSIRHTGGVLDNECGAMNG